ncbi:uncharacterized protein LOC106636999 [Copidosoma floridanum]|uniref:uncharacterized protein LOC106636999 n=1 Tax=Copidosoma floridanum TaxID=29053 RepID=UPI0006C96787|nr:uncharacterized protein LOC106636999 [Copidosoma floridanum]
MEANKLLLDREIQQHNLETFIPGFRKQRKAIARNIPTHLTVQQILEACKSEIKISSVSRFNRRNRNPTSEEDKWIPSRSIIITFDGQTLPIEVYIFNVKTFITPYVSRPMQCYNCLRYGHTTKTCKARKICNVCGEVEQENCCDKKSLKCINCVGNHRSTDKTFEIYEKYLRINTIMAYHNLSFVEAKNIIMPKPAHPPINSKENFLALKENKNVKLYSQIAEEYKTLVSEHKKGKGHTKTTEHKERNIKFYGDVESEAYTDPTAADKRQGDPRPHATPQANKTSASFQHHHQEQPGPLQHPNKLPGTTTAAELIGKIIKKTEEERLEKWVTKNKNKKGNK